MSNSTPSRRRLLQVGGSAILATIAGCTGQPSQNATESDSQSDSSTDPQTQVYQETIDSVVLVQTDEGAGTGFIYDNTHVVTNAHVVGEAASTEIRFSEGQWTTGEVVGTDRHSDLAVIAVETVPERATPLSFIDGETEVGQNVVAIGNPFSFDGTATAGIVSGVDRSIPSPTGFTIPDAIQTDAAVNPGNSGGPLMSLEGRIVAVINSGGGDNLGFGISAPLARRVIPELIETGSYEHSYMGVSFANVTPDIAEANGMDEPRGLLVDEVVDDGPAAGVLQPSEESETVDGTQLPVGGDVMLALDGTELLTSEDLGNYLALQTRPGDTVELTILRDGSEQSVEMTLGTRPDELSR
ncbi:S1-C subfamily serine protease [Halohasta litchfieldiae]|uniref:Serine protease, S1-C subfamily, contains C-terminal PDZ domain n=1 Tax=Halohasta litchfieldiae TaxID=1073996 RepID=A0A1H6RHL7_9EURY|nr:trypsin-like peptidase domain-containing protein [Halohasta litchfieldiae]ATW89782.1 S1-C subfamily serine protease [Halohasta litchfieldiae]SEI52794.1 serine protease, S1-C subfamily, contains C-terminal PDZ domain [Halohasta litchfieldiae]